jgi:predicted protein tyrosine phosphatase
MAGNRSDKAVELTARVNRQRTDIAMNEIAPYRVWVGHAGDGRALEELFERGITAVVQLAAEEPTIPTPRDMLFCRFPLEDGTGNDPDFLSLAITAVADLISRGVPTLVCCGGGMSRSPAVVAAALAILEVREPGEALRFVTSQHPADVVPGFWREICQAVAAMEELDGE